MRVTEPVGNTTLEVHWDPPLSNGGRLDGFHYNVEYREVGDLGAWIRANEDRVRSNTYLIPGLKPVTRYMIRIIAGNNVSDQEPESVGDRTTTSVVKTTEGGKFLHCFRNSINEVFLEVAIIFLNLTCTHHLPQFAIYLEVVPATFVWLHLMTII